MSAQDKKPKDDTDAGASKEKPGAKKRDIFGEVFKDDNGAGNGAETPRPLEDVFSQEPSPEEQTAEPLPSTDAPVTEEAPGPTAEQSEHEELDGLFPEEQISSETGEPSLVQRKKYSLKGHFRTQWRKYATAAVLLAAVPVLAYIGLRGHRIFAPKPTSDSYITTAPKKEEESDLEKKVETPTTLPETKPSTVLKPAEQKPAEKPGQPESTGAPEAPGIPESKPEYKPAEQKPAEKPGQPETPRDLEAKAKEKPKAKVTYIGDNKASIYVQPVDNKPFTILVKGPTTKKNSILELIEKAELSKDFYETRTDAIARIIPAKYWRVVPSTHFRYAVKKYPEGRASEIQEGSTGIRVGRYFDLSSLLKDDFTAYAELGAIAEGTRRTNRSSLSHNNGLFTATLAFLSEDQTTNIKAVIGAGAGRYEIEPTGKLTTKREGSLFKAIADLQASQNIFKEVYARGRANLVQYNFRDWDNYRALALELGAGLRGKIPDVFKRAFIEAAITYRNESNDYFNGTERQREIYGGRIRAGAQLSNKLEAEFALQYDTELLLGTVLELSTRF